jgi:hypothetical protein
MKAVTKLDIFKSDETQYSSFPGSVMTGVAGNFANTLVQVMEAPKAFLFMSYLTCLGAITSFKISLLSSIAPQPRMYTVLVGGSSTTRKSTSINKTVEFFEGTLLPSYPWICNGVNSAEGLATKLQEFPIRLLCIDEFTTLVSKMKHGTSVLLPCINSLLEKNTYDVVTKKNSIHLRGVYLSMLTASTGETFERMFNPKFSDIGFLNRLFLVHETGQKKFSIPPPIPQQVVLGLQNDLNEIMAFVAELAGWGDDVYKMPIKPDAFSLFDKWYHNIPASPFTNRLDTYGHRLMLLLALNEMKDCIDTAVMEKVIALLNYQLKVREFLAPIDAFNSMARLEESIRRQLKKRAPLTKGQLERGCHKSRHGIVMWKNAIKHLMDSGQIEFLNSKYSMVAGVE